MLEFSRIARLLISADVFSISFGSGLSPDERAVRRELLLI